MKTKDWSESYLTLKKPIPYWLISINKRGALKKYPTDYRAYEDLTNDSVPINGPQTPSKPRVE